MLINGKPFIKALAPLPRRPLTNAQRLAASDVRQPHHASLSQWLKGNIYCCPNESDLNQLDADDVLCSVRMRYRKADDDGSISKAPTFTTSSSPSKLPLVPASPHLMLGHWSGSHEDGDAPDWTGYMRADRTYTFCESRPFMARFVCGLTPIWVGDVSQQTVSPRMMNWAVANARGTRALAEVTLQRRRLMARLAQEIVNSLSLQFPHHGRWFRGRDAARTRKQRGKKEKERKDLRRWGRRIEGVTKLRACLSHGPTQAWLRAAHSAVGVAYSARTSGSDKERHLATGARASVVNESRGRSRSPLRRRCIGTSSALVRLGSATMGLARDVGPAAVLPASRFDACAPTSRRAIGVCKSLVGRGLSTAGLGKKTASQHEKEGEREKNGGLETLEKEWTPELSSIGSWAQPPIGHATRNRAHGEFAVDSQKTPLLRGWSCGRHTGMPCWKRVAKVDMSRTWPELEFAVEEEEKRRNVLFLPDDLLAAALAALEAQGGSIAAPLQALRTHLAATAAHTMPPPREYRLTTTSRPSGPPPPSTLVARSLPAEGLFQSAARRLRQLGARPRARSVPLPDDDFFHEHGFQMLSHRMDAASTSTVNGGKKDCLEECRQRQRFGDGAGLNQARLLDKGANGLNSGL
ncbi:hypothetical protein C8R47DRAFT_1074455 [Mycena vitilis]|nr:hypothetical protein C8R47DRAFT_1074455 [Mycena vitilis]